MKCSSCGFEGEKAWKFCPECGERSSAASSASGVEADVSLGAMRTLPEAPAGAQGGGTEPDVSFAAATMVGPGPAESGASHVGASAPLADRYELLEEIGRGGFAVVWKARDGKMGRIVAIKRLLPEAMTGSGGAQTLARFQREAEAIARLNHRNIVAVYDRGEDERGPYIVMEFVEGGSLRAYAKSKGGKLAVPEAVALVRGVVQGLSFAHRSNLVHRDIKPANILLHLDPSARADSERVVPKIVDFGLARAGGDSELSMSGYGMGTPWYMPPEQRRDAKGVNHTADIYAVGKMLYELVSGDVPDNVDPSKIPPEAGLAEAIFTCIKSNPAERYFSADELLDALDKVGRKGTGKPIPGAVTLKAGDNPCPSCGAPNAVDAKFCESCGAGMTRVCPECGRENSVHRQFCSGCGTDVEGFLKWAEALPVMQKYVGEKRWSRVVKEHGLLPQDVKLRGAKGNNLKAECDKLLGQAQTSIQERDQLLAEIRKMKDSGEIVRTLDAVTRCLDVDPHQDDIKTLQPIYRKLAEMEKDMASRLDAADFDGAQAALTAMKTAGLPDDSFKSLSLKVRQNRNDFAAFSAQVASLGREGRVEAAVKTLGDSLQLWPACASMQAEQARLSERVKTLREHLDGARSAIAVKSWRRALAWSQRAMEIDPAHREASEFRSLAERMIKRNKTKNKIGLVLIAVAAAVYAGATAYSNVQKARHAREAAAKVESLLKEAGEARDAKDWAKCFDLSCAVMAIAPTNPLAVKLNDEAGARVVPEQNKAWRVPEVGMVLMPVSAGSFRMGSEDGDGDEKPVRTVRISRDFWMGKTEVTQAEYRKVTGKSPSGFKGDDLPVENVSWTEAVAFCDELTRRERAAGRLPQGYEYRLPTEAEWEYSAKGGSKSKGFTYSGGNDIDAVALHGGNSGSTTHPVGQKAANELGLCDMSGNVWEWCSDWYQDSYSGLPDADPIGPGTGSYRVFRGGSWSIVASNCRAAYRNRFRPSFANFNLGLRVVLAPVP